MEYKVAEAIVQEMENNGVDAEIRESYSGRGMYGKTTTGIVCDDPVVVGFYAGICAGIAEGITSGDLYEDLAPDDFFSAFGDGCRIDNMGKRTIVY